MATIELFLSRMTENSLENTFEIVRSSIVAFASRVVRSERPQFPDIIGTGFVVDARGVVARESAL
jgi:hypothetical protein